MSIADRGQAATPSPPPPTPPPPASSSDEEFDDDDNTDDLLDPIRDAKFLADAEKEAEEERAAHAGFDAEMERRRVAAAAATEDDDSDISWSCDDPDAPTPEEKVAGQRALVDSFETLKKAEDAVNETLWRCLLEDAAAHLALVVAWQAAEKQTREGRNDAASCSK
jgi:hypothetical protein